MRKPVPAYSSRRHMTATRRRGDNADENRRHGAKAARARHPLSTPMKCRKTSWANEAEKRAASMSVRQSEQWKPM